MLSSVLFVLAVELVDPARVRVMGDPAEAVVAVTVPPQPRVIDCEVLVAGAGAGGVGAALRLAERGHTVCLTEETDWIGGQLTAGGVSALDEHKFIEIAGGTRSYSALRDGIRAAYRAKYRLAPAVAAMENFNPGACYVSSLCYEPKVGLAVLEKMLAPHAARIRRLMRTQVFALTREGGRITEALAYRFDAREVVRLRFRFVLDATELGDLLPLAKAPYTLGSEPRAETGEPNAAEKANPACVQSFTYTFAVERRPEGENHRGAKPPDYERIRDHQPFSLTMNYPAEFGWRGTFTYKVFGEDDPIPNNMSPLPFFPWRRLVAAKNFTGPGAPTTDIALMNWPRQDYHDESVLDRSPLDTARILQAAKRVAAAFLYWMQTDIPRDDGAGTGYANFKLRADVMGTNDGFSKYPYIREARRLKARGRVTQQDIVFEDDRARAKWFDDSVGTGFYMVDIHPCGANERGRMMMPKPFQVPMATLEPRELENFLAAGKSLGVTHLTNGAFRLHPIEWNIGEAAAVMASRWLRDGRYDARGVQRALVDSGVAVVWFDDLPVRHPAFSAIQWAAIRGLYPLEDGNLHAAPDAPLTRTEARRLLARWKGVSEEEVMRRGWMAVDHRNWFHGGLPLYWTDIRAAAGLPSHPAMKRTGPVTRAEWAIRLR